MGHRGKNCNVCRMDNATLREYRVRQGEIGEDDFAPEFRHKKKAKRKPRKRGCPGNDGNEHVYDWQPYEFPHDMNMYRDYDIYISKCIGCGRRDNRPWKRIPK